MQTIVAMLLWFQLKHFVADYLLQPGWILHGKGDLRRAGGYVHAAIHAGGSLPAFAIAVPDLAVVTGMFAAEFAVHYVIDFTKAGVSSRSLAGPETQAYWTIHGADQLLHQLTYIGLILVAARLA